MGLPEAKVIKTNGNLGRVTPRDTGISGIIATGIPVADSFDLDEVLGPFYSLADIEGKGITEEYDEVNSLLLWRHCSDFYKGAGNGTALYLMAVTATVTMKDIADATKDYAAKMLRSANGDIRMVAITRMPPADYIPAVTSGLDDDAIDAVLKAQVLAESEFDAFRPVDFWVEGRAFNGIAGSCRSLRNVATSPNANAVSVVISSDPEVVALNNTYRKYANVCYAMGCAAAVHTGRNIGRVRSGQLDVLSASLSNGINIRTLVETQPSALNTLNDYGYIFIRTFEGKSGFYWNDDHNACPLKDDYAYKNRSRTANECARIARETYTEYINDDLDVDEDTGQLSPAVIKDFQEQLEDDIANSMDEAISGVSVYVDPEQNILATDEIEAELNIVPKGIAKNITVRLGFKNPFN